MRRQCKATEGHGVEDRGTGKKIRYDGGFHGLAPEARTKRPYGAKRNSSLTPPSPGGRGGKQRPSSAFAEAHPRQIT